MSMNYHHGRKLWLLALVCAGTAVLYMTVGIRFGNNVLMRYAFSIRLPKLLAMLIVAFTIGSASLVFQSIINNTIVTPCLLGMNSLYTLIHTTVVFAAGMGNILTVNKNAAFLFSAALMSMTAAFIYGYIFKKTRYNVLYILLIGTVLTSFFSSIQNTMIRVMDPNEYDALLAMLVASFSKITVPLIAVSIILIALIIFVLKKDIALLDVITLGKDQAINLGIPYDRTIRRLLVGVTLCIAVATALAGPLSFIGLITANLSRQFLKTYRHIELTAGSALFGIILLVAGQLIVERICTYTVPISVFITVAGGIYFLYLLIKSAP